MPKYRDTQTGEILTQEQFDALPEQTGLFQGEGQVQRPSFLQKMAKGALKYQTEPAIGAVKGIASTVRGLSSLMEKGIKTVMPQPAQRFLGLKPDQTIAEQMIPQSFTQTKTPLEAIGKTAEQVGEFFIPTGIPTKGALFVGKLAQEGTKLSTVLRIAGESLGLGTEFAGKTAVQTGGDIQQMKEAGITGAITPPIFRGGGEGLKRIGPTIGDVASGVIAQMIGKSPEHIKRAFQNPIKVAQAIARKIIPDDVRIKAIDALQSFKTTISSNFEMGLTKLQEISKNILPYTQRTISQSVEPIIQDTVKGIPGIFRQMKVGVKNTGELLFDRSAIVKGGEQKNLQAVYDTIKNQKDFSPDGMQSTAARINALSRFTEGAKEESSVIIAKIHNLYSRAIENVYPDLAKLRNQYRVEIEIANGIDDILKSVKNEVANPTAVTGVNKKLSNLFAEDNEVYVRALKTLEDKAGVDLLNELAATEFKNIIPGRFGSYLYQAGVMAGGIMYNPLILAVLPLFSPRLQGKIITTAGKLAPGIVKTAQRAEQVLPRLFLGRNRE